MIKHLSTPLISLNGQHKDSNYLAQTQRVNKAFFFEKPKTMLQVSFETGIFRANICRYVAQWKTEQPYCSCKDWNLPDNKM